MSQKIQVRRGLKSDLPTLAEGELGFCTDTKEYFIGSSSGNVPLANANNLSVGSNTYETEAIGELFLPPANYNAWAPSNLRFDKTRGVFAVLINGANAHVFSTIDQYFCTIDPKTLIATKPKLISVVDTEGNPVTFDETSSNNFMILDDGTYMYFLRKSGIYHRITSINGGETWVDQGIISVTPSLNTSANIWGIQKLSNGRLICGFGAHTDTKGKVMYSDDLGINWTFISVGTTLPAGSTCAEPHIIEVSPNKLISIARKSTEGLTKGVVGGTPDPAVISFSNDNGLTWTNYVDSTSITNMNASTATSYVHDGIVEMFIAARFYETSENVNTGKMGALYHYVATIENALQDKFTLKKVALYANAADSTDFHAPCVAVDDEKRLLLMLMDQSKYAFADVNYRFVRGMLGFVPYPVLDGLKSPYFGYSGKQIESLLSGLKTEIASLQYLASKITSSTNPVPEPKGTLIWTKTYHAERDQVLIDHVSSNFAGTFYTASSASNYHSLQENADGMSYNYNGTNWALAVPTTKPNFAIHFKGKIGNNAANHVVPGAIINGVVYGLYRLGASYGVVNSQIYDFRFEYWNGTMKGFIDGVELPVKTVPFDSTNLSGYADYMTLIGTYDSSKKYAIIGNQQGTHIYEMKYGDWN